MAKRRKHVTAEEALKQRDYWDSILNGLGDEREKAFSEYLFTDDFKSKLVRIDTDAELKELAKVIYDNFDTLMNTTRNHIKEKMEKRSKRANQVKGNETELTQQAEKKVVKKVPEVNDQTSKKVSAVSGQTSHKVSETANKVPVQNTDNVNRNEESSTQKLFGNSPMQYVPQ